MDVILGMPPECTLFNCRPVANHTHKRPYQMKNTLLLLFVLFVCACQPAEQSTVTASNSPAQAATDHHVEEISKVFDAHGGYANWMKLKSLSYENGGSKTLVDLQHRFTLIESENQTVGFEGEYVWVNPPIKNADQQRLRYNLMFYFYAFPFVVGDPGVYYESLPAKILNGIPYNAVKVSYEEGVGDSPKDNYIILSDQETNRMEWLLYTATFGGQETKDQYSLIRYTGWQEQGGVWLPTSLQ